MNRIRNGFLTLAVTACLLLGASIAVTPATASEITFNFTGITVADPIGGFSGGFFNNVLGSFRFDNSDNTGGAYPNVVKDFTVTFLTNGYTTSFTPGANAVKIENDIDNGAGFTVDRWSLSTDVANSSDPVFPPYSSSRADLTFDRLQSVHPFTNTDMQSPPSLASATSIPEINRLRVFFDVGNTGTVQVVQVALTNMNVVPLPPAVILFGAGLVALIGLGARNWQREPRARVA